MLTIRSRPIRSILSLPAICVSAAPILSFRSVFGTATLGCRRLHELAAGPVLSGAYGIREFPVREKFSRLALGWQGTRPLRNHCHLNLFWNLRGSILWGDARAAAATSAFATDRAAAALAEDWAVAGTGGDMFIGEVQLGLQYERQLQCAPVQSLRPRCLRIPVLGQRRRSPRGHNLRRRSRNLRKCRNGRRRRLGTGSDRLQRWNRTHLVSRQRPQPPH